MYNILALWQEIKTAKVKTNKTKAIFISSHKEKIFSFCSSIEQFKHCFFIKSIQNCSFIEIFIDILVKSIEIANNKTHF